MAKTKHRVAPSMDNIYTLDGKVPLLKSIPFGLQHVLAMFVANIAPIMIVTGASGLSTQVSVLWSSFSQFGSWVRSCPL